MDFMAFFQIDTPTHQRIFRLGDEMQFVVFRWSCCYGAGGEFLPSHG